MKLRLKTGPSAHITSQDLLPDAQIILCSFGGGIIIISSDNGGAVTISVAGNRRQLMVSPVKAGVIEVRTKI